MIGPLLAAQNAGAGRQVLAASGEIIIGQSPVTQVLHIDREMRTSADHRSTAGRVYLVLQGPTADVPPGITYDVFLDLPAKNLGHAMDKYFVGSLNFYEIHQHSFLSFDITSRLHQPIKPSGDFMVTIIPNGKPASDSHIHIDAIQLVLLQQGA